MKKIVKYITGLLTVLFLLSSCEMWIDTDMNTDPDQPMDVPMNLLLPSIQSNLAYSYGGNNTVRVSGLWMQHFQGVTRQSATQANYVFGNSDVNNYWNSMYASNMMDCKVLMDKATEEESPHWRGVSSVLLAIALGQMTDFFGNIPYSEGFQGVDNLTPIQDSQESLYTEIQSMLDAAIADLGASDNAIPLSGDMMYDGDTDAWVKAAYALKARFYIHTAAVNTNASSSALSAITNAFASSADDMLFQYGPGPSTEACPLFQFMNERGDIRMGATLIDALKADNDPRLSVIADTNTVGEYVGGTIGVSTDAEDLSFPNPDNRFFTPAGITMFMSYAEQKFIEAEALVRTGGDATQAFQDAVQASLEEWGVFDQTWFDNNIVAISTPTLSDVFYQKWIAMFGQSEMYHDWRRSDNEIGLALSPNASIDQIPYRWPYATSEQTYNVENTPQGRDLQSPVWWMGSKDPSPKK